ncbi:MAG: hypothetical protein EAZ95_04140 [Bacteroidetes bacterium]|nr:MAG: hypothetical protein EAZ95_04140 [Bacteroidota bacterium]
MNRMQNVLETLKKYFRQLDNAEGEAEIEPIMQALNAYIASLNESEKRRANAEFNYYISKRIAQTEERVNKVAFEMQKASV